MVRGDLEEMVSSQPKSGKKEGRREGGRKGRKKKIKRIIRERGTKRKGNKEPREGEGESEEGKDTGVLKTVK